MAEDIIIGGFGSDREFPDFAKEATQKSIENVLKQANVFNREATRYLSMIAGKNEKQSHEAMKALTGEVKKSAKLQQDAKTEAQKLREQEEKASKKEISLMQVALGYDEKILAANERSEKQQERIAKLTEQGYSKNSATFKTMLEKFSVVGGAIGKAVTAVAAATVGVNAYVKQQATDRFNFAQELRQSGLAANLSTGQASLTGFAETVNRANFTLGEAADFTQRFSKSVGVLGVAGALDFVNKLAFAGEEGGDLMRNFGLEFGEVKNLAGEYLDTVRNIGMLERMNNAELRRGMDDFMDAVVTTSNVLKVGMEEAAQIIKETLSRDDIASLLGTMDPARAAQVQEVVGLAGGMDSGLGEALAQRLAAGSQAEFQITSQYASMLSDPITAGILPIVEQLAQATETGGVSGFQNALANSDAALENFLRDAASNREILLTGEGNAIVASVQRLRQNFDDANAGFTPISQDDNAVLGAQEATRQFTLSIEAVNNAFIENADLATNLTKLNESNIALAQEIQVLGSQAADFAGKTLVDATTGLQAISTDLVSGGLNIVSGIAASMSDDMEQMKADTAAMRRNVTQTFGVMTDLAVSRDAINSGNNYLNALENPNSSRAEVNIARQNLHEELLALEANDPEQARRLRESYGLDNIVTSGTVNYDPTMLQNQGHSVNFSNMDEDERYFVRSGIFGNGAHKLIGGGLMETRDAAQLRVRGELSGLASSRGVDSRTGLDMINALLSGDGSALLDAVGFDKSGDDFTTQEQAFLNELVTEISKNNLMDKETLQQMIETVTGDNGRSFFDWTAASEAEKAERGELLRTMKELVRNLQ